ncbi:MAG: response regulator transcription factor [Chloroflexi bacterium]|nr:response regulator transcription factor [Chloroflexota bacterium]
MAAIVLVEDDPAIARSVSRILETNGYQVSTAENAADARTMLSHFRPELIMLDLMLPDGDGLVLLPALRALTDAPIIICSSRQRQLDRVLGLRLGADDFLAKPFDIDELEARVEAVLRRASHPRLKAPEPQAQIHVGDLLISQSHGTVTLGGAKVHLTPTEFHLLVALASRPQELLSREELGHIVWGDADYGTGHLIDVHMWRLRLKLRRASPSPSLETVRGRGYRLAFLEEGNGP